MRLLGTKGLKSKGINYSPEHLRRLVKAGQFPPPIKRAGGRLLAWPEGEIDQWIADLVAARDVQQMKTRGGVENGAARGRT